MESLSYQFAPPYWAIVATNCAVVTACLMIAIACQSSIRSRADKALLIVGSLFYFWRGGTISYSGEVTFNSAIMLAANCAGAAYILARLLRKKD